MKVVHGLPVSCETDICQIKVLLWTNDIKTSQEGCGHWQRVINLTAAAI